MSKRPTREELMLLSKEQLVDIILHLFDEIDKLKARIEELEAKNNIKPNSKNSSKPPSQDFKSNLEDTKGKSKKKGPPKGHKGHSRKLVENPDEVVELKIVRCPYCGIPKTSNSNCYEIHQILELVELRFKTTEYRRQKTSCGYCNHSYLADNPTGVLDNELLGPKAQAFLALLTHHCNLSQNQTIDFIHTFSGVKLSKGIINNTLSRIGKKYNAEYLQLIEELKSSNCVGIDETGWRVNGKNHWLWVFQDKRSTVFSIADNRSHKVIKSILGDYLSGVMVSDFFSAYGKIGANAKQKCIPHLLRALQQGIELDQKLGKFDNVFCNRAKKLFQIAVKLKSAIGQSPDDDFSSKVLQVKRVFSRLLRKRPNGEISKRLLKRMIKFRDELLLFLYDPNVPADNNASERALRQLVIKRKISFGSRSIVGKERTAIISSIIATIKKRKLPLFETLVEKISSYSVSKQKRYTLDTI